MRTYALGALLLATAGAPGRADACSCGIPDVAMSPADQATDVPLNAIMIARWDHAYTPTLELRDAMTHDVIPLVQEVRRPNSGPFGISLIGTPVAPLAASTTYELVAHDDSWTDTIATFTTGDAIDTTAPAFVGLAGLTLERMPYPVPNEDGSVCQSSCVGAPDGYISRIRLDYVDPPPDAVHVVMRFRRAGDASYVELPVTRFAPRYFGYTSCVVGAPKLESGAEYCARIVVYDIAGNASGDDVEVCSTVFECAPVPPASAFDCEPSDECRVPLTVAPPEPDAGCSITRSPSWLVLAVLALLLPKRRTRRAFRGARRVL